MEQRIHITATIDALGHTCIAIKLRTLEFDEKLTAKLFFEAGQLEATSNEIDALFKYCERSWKVNSGTRGR